MYELTGVDGLTKKEVVEILDLMLSTIRDEVPEDTIIHVVRIGETLDEVKPSNTPEDCEWVYKEK